MRPLIGLTAALLLSASPTQAQSAQASADRAGRIELAIGPIWVGRASFGSRDANETTGSGGTLRLFSTSTELAGVSGLEGHVGVRVMRGLDVEASGSYAKPRLQTQVDSDFETSNAPLTVSDTIRQFTIGGAVLWYPRLQPLGTRTRVFVRGGAGYLRQLENEGALVVTGHEYDAGGGVKFALASRQSGWWKGIGARVDARVAVRQKGAAPDDRAHASPVVSASIFARF